MPKRIPLPKVCPVCGGDSLARMRRRPLGSSEAIRKAISGLLGFRCGKGHVFLISESDLIKSPVKAIKQSGSRAGNKMIPIQTKLPNRAKENKNSAS